MDNVREIFLAALNAALQGKSAQIEGVPTPEDWRQVLELARIHHVEPLIFEAVYPLLRQTDAALGAALRKRVLGQMMVQTVKTGAFLELSRKLCDAGIRPLVVKGLVCRALYPNSDARASGDEDLLIPEEEFAACHQVLYDFGMHTPMEEEDWIQAHEIPYRMEGSPLYIELHKNLFPPRSEVYGDLNRFFQHVHGHPEMVEIQGRQVYTLECTDHLFYLICHAFKHFLHSGFGIRQVCDIVLFANCYGTRIDWMRILKNCREIHADKFAAALFRIGSRYLVFDPDAAAYPAAWREIRVDEQPLLEDLLSGGLYGDSSMSRKHSSNITLSAAASRKQGGKEKHTVLASVFPRAEKLERRYPYLKKHAWLLPVAWGQRLWNYSRETRREKDSNAAQALKIGRERVELMKEYGIVE